MVGVEASAKETASAEQAATEKPILRKFPQRSQHLRNVLQMGTCTKEACAKDTAPAEDPSTEAAAAEGPTPVETAQSAASVCHMRLHE
mmetsp:Transcript_52251/g.93257  ORF Transcript_52251/g.93257 Transcript_52251/m.93257 type:complete len:88 (+) Transcript_52251:217-480(+)